VRTLTPSQIDEVTGNFLHLEVQVKARSGQALFKKQVLDAYGGRCAVSGCDVAAVLDAAHIESYSGPLSNDVQNGLCLRCDIHRLFDAHLIEICEDLSIRVSLRLRETDYWQFNGAPLR
jgi:5-methylcytosine-specific restriction protein A